MIEYIDHQLTQWARWLRSDRVRLGYPRQSAFVVAIGGAHGKELTLPDDDALLLCQAVQALPPDLREVVDCYYCRMVEKSSEEIAQKLGCCRQTVYVRLGKAHAALLGNLNDLAAGIDVLPNVAPDRKKTA